MLRRGREVGAFHHADDMLAARLVYGMVWSGSADSAWSDDAVSAAILGMVRGTRQQPKPRRAANNDRPAPVSELRQSATPLPDGVPL